MHGKAEEKLKLTESMFAETRPNFQKKLPKQKIERSKF
jgi:hypothetical protein